MSTRPRMSSVVAPSVSDGPAQRVSNMSRMFEKTNNRCAQRHSKVSESDGCPSGNAGRMGEIVSAQRHSKLSESEARECGSEKWKARKVENRKTLCSTALQSIGVGSPRMRE